MGIFQGKGGTKNTDSRNSASQGTSVGSGSRPTPSKIKLDSSAPADPRNLGGRGDVPGKLGGQGTVKQVA